MSVRRVKNVGRALLLLFSLVALLSAVAGCDTEVATKVNFLSDWKVAKDQAASDGKPIMIYFYTDV